jgi:UPF0755 protein
MDDNASFFYQKIFAPFVLCCIAFAVAFFVFELQPVSKFPKYETIIVKKGSGLSAVANDLQDKNIIRSALLFKILGLGRDRDIQAGTYEVSPDQSPFSLLGYLLKGPEMAHVTIPEGSSVYDVDEILGEANVLKPGELVTFAETVSVEGKLFPDTYDFPLHDSVKDIAQTMMENYKNKALPILDRSKNAQEDLIIASLLEKEVVSMEDRQIVAGIIKKRLKADMPLQIDATICYAKRAASANFGVFNCYPLAALDFKRPSPYNTYLHRGLPPGPIGSPGVGALASAVSPRETSYWYYLSDPVSKRTIFSKTLDEQSSSRARYLK